MHSSCTFLQTLNQDILAIIAEKVQSGRGRLQLLFGPSSPFADAFGKMLQGQRCIRSICQLVRTGCPKLKEAYFHTCEQYQYASRLESYGAQLDRANFKEFYKEIYLPLLEHVLNKVYINISRMLSPESTEVHYASLLLAPRVRSVYSCNYGMPYGGPSMDYILDICWRLSSLEHDRYTFSLIVLGCILQTCNLRFQSVSFQNFGVDRSGDVIRQIARNVPNLLHIRLLWPN